MCHLKSLMNVNSRLSCKFGRKLLLDCFEQSCSQAGIHQHMKPMNQCKTRLMNVSKEECGTGQPVCLMERVHLSRQKSLHAHVKIGHYLPGIVILGTCIVIVGDSIRKMNSTCKSSFCWCLVCVLCHYAMFYIILRLLMLP